MAFKDTRTGQYAYVLAGSPTTAAWLYQSKSAERALSHMFWTHEHNCPCKTIPVLEHYIVLLFDGLREAFQGRVSES